jgi:chromosome segregation ATPase
MINEIYLKRALEIRKEYLRLLNDIESYENVARDLIKSISDRKSELEDLLQKINENRVSNPDEATQKLSSIIMMVEDDMNRVDKSINQINSKMDKLKDEEVILYNEIKNTYIELSDESIIDQIKKFIEDKI